MNMQNIEKKLQPAPTTRESPPLLDAVILAAGLGTRMRSRTAKVLHNLGGRPLIAHVCDTVKALEPRRVCVVVGHQADAVRQVTEREFGSDANLSFATQVTQLGTGDAVAATREFFADTDSTLLILSGDVPLVRPETLVTLVQQHRTHRGRGAACTILSVRIDDPTNYGRIVRDAEGLFEKIVEQKDATPEERQINEINAGIYCFETRALFSALAEVKPANAQGEYYLTDVPGILRARGDDVCLYQHTDAREVSGINTRLELADFEGILLRHTMRRLMLESGVTLIDPKRTYVSSEARIGRDTVIHPNVQIEGSTVIGDECVIRPGARITNSQIGSGVLVNDHSIIVDSQIANGCSVGPFAHLRMNSVMEEGAAVGNFVELKKTRIGRNSKSMHLTYLGDATIGERVNIGAGTVTCNFDGVNKNPTAIEDDVKIGSDTMLVAPVRVGARATTGAGSVVTKDVAPDTLVAGVPARERPRNETPRANRPARQQQAETQRTGRAPDAEKPSEEELEAATQKG